LKSVFYGKNIRNVYAARLHPASPMSGSKLKILEVDEILQGYETIVEMDLSFQMSAGDFFDFSENNIKNAVKIEKVVYKLNEIEYYMDYISSYSENEESKKQALEEIEYSKIEEERRWAIKIT
jgi:hypothetical protein